MYRLHHNSKKSFLGIASHIIQRSHQSILFKQLKLVSRYIEYSTKRVEIHILMFFLISFEHKKNSLKTGRLPKILQVVFKTISQNIIIFIFGNALVEENGEEIRAKTQLDLYFLERSLHCYDLFKF